MNITFKLTDGDMAFTVLEQRFDFHTAPAFRKAVDEALKQPPTSASVDLGAAGSIDSSAISALLYLHEKLPQEARPLLLKNVRPEILCVIELMRLHRVFALDLDSPAA